LAAAAVAELVDLVLHRSVRESRARQPEPAVTAFVGTSPSFSAKASGLGALAPKYQWFKNAGTLIAGATTTSYSLVGAQPGDSGTTFYCVATNGFGAITSTVGTLTVIAAPVQSYPAAVLANSPKGYWRLNEPDNGLGNNGVLKNEVCVFRLDVEEPVDRLIKSIISEDEEIPAQCH